MYYEKEFVRRDETGNFVFSRLHRTERTTEAVQSITGRTRPVGTPHGTALRHQATELHAPAIRNGHRHPRQAGGNGRRFPRMAVRLEPQHVSNERGSHYKSGRNAHFCAENGRNVHECAIMHTPSAGPTYLCIVIRTTRELQNQKTNF